MIRWRLFPTRTANGLVKAFVRSYARRSVPRNRRSSRVRPPPSTRLDLQPVAFPGDSFALDALAGALADLASEAVYDEPAPLEEYGLTDKVAVGEVGGMDTIVQLIADSSKVVTV